jgi:hypothetical protein
MQQVPKINKDDFDDLAAKYQYDAGMSAEDAKQRALKELAERGREKTLPFPGADVSDQENDRIILPYNKITDLHERSGICAKALKDREAPLFSKGGILAAVQGEAGERKILAADVFRLRHEVSKAVRYVKIKYEDNGAKAIPVLAPPLEDIRDLLAGYADTFHKIHGVVSHPIVTMDGKIISSAGYNEETGFFIDTEGDMLKISETPAGTDIESGVEVFRDFLSDFPFADPEAGFANTIGLFLTILLRNIVPDIVPLFWLRPR